MPSRGIFRSPPHPAFPISRRVSSLTAVPLGVHSSPCCPCPHPGPLTLPRSLSGSPPHSPSRSSGALVEPLATPLPGCSRPLRRDSGCHSGARALTSALVTRGPGAAASSHSCPKSLSCWVFACWVPTRSLRPRVPVAPHSPRRTLGCLRCCCPRCGSARGDQSHPTARSAPRPHSTPPTDSAHSHALIGSLLTFPDRRSLGPGGI